MRQLVRDNQCGNVEVVLRGIVRQHPDLVECDYPGILHRKSTEFSYENLVVFVEWVIKAKFLTIQLHAFYCHVEDELGIVLQFLVCCRDAE